MAHGGHGGHFSNGVHHGFPSGYGGGAFRPIFPLLLYPMMGYLMYGRQYYVAQTGEQQLIDFTAKLYFNLEWQNSFGGLITEQTVVQETASIFDFAEKLENFLHASNFREVIAISVDGTEI